MKLLDPTRTITTAVLFSLCTDPPAPPPARFYMQEPGFSREVRLGFALLPQDQSRVRSSDSLCKPPLRHAFDYKNADFGYPRCWPRATVLDRGGRDVYIRNGERAGKIDRDIELAYRIGKRQTFRTCKRQTYRTGRGRHVRQTETGM